MARLYLTRLVLPFAFVAILLAIPFLWTPDVADVEKPVPAPPSQTETRPATTPFQRTMTLGFALILISVTAGGIMLYRITRQQTASWRRRFAPRKKP